MSNFDVQARISVADLTSPALKKINREWRKLQKAMANGKSFMPQTREIQAAKRVMQFQDQNYEKARRIIKMTEKSGDATKAKSKDSIKDLAKEAAAMKYKVNAIMAIGGAFDLAAASANRAAKAFQAANKAGGGVSGGGRPEHWRNLSSKDRFKYRAEAGMQYAPINRMAHRGIDAVAGLGGSIKDASTDRLRAKLENLPAGIQAAIDAGSNDASNKYRAMPAHLINEVARDAFGNLDNMDEKNAKALTGVIGKAMQSEFIRTGDIEESKRSSGRAARYADLGGKAGNAESLNKELETWSRIMIAGGRDLKSDEVLAGFKGVKTLLSGLSTDAKIKAGLMFSETGQRGGNELFQFVDSFAGKRITEDAMAGQKKAGLRDKNDKVKDAPLLYSDPDKWMEKHIKPIMQKQGVKFDGSEEDNAKIAEKAKDFGLRGTAENYIAREMIKLQERERGLKKANRANVSDSFIGGATSQSIEMSFKAVSASAGSAADALTKILQPAITGSADSLAKFLGRVANDESSIASARVAAMLGGTFITALAGFDKATLANGSAASMQLLAAKTQLAASKKIALGNNVPDIGGGKGAGGLAMGLLKKAGWVGVALTGMEMLNEATTLFNKNGETAFQLMKKALIPDAKAEQTQKNVEDSQYSHLSKGMQEQIKRLQEAEKKNEDAKKPVDGYRLRDTTISNDPEAAREAMRAKGRLGLDHMKDGDVKTWLSQVQSQVKGKARSDQRSEENSSARVDVRMQKHHKSLLPVEDINNIARGEFAKMREEYLKVVRAENDKETQKRYTTADPTDAMGNTISTAMSDAAGNFDATAKYFSSVIDAVPEKLSSAGQEISNQMTAAASSAGAAIAAAITAAASKITVNVKVNQPKMDTP